MTVRILTGDCRDVLPTLEADSVDCVVTSPPYYGLRNYGVEGQVGLETTFVEYVEVMVNVFREVRRVLRSDGVCWLNLGDSYASGKGTCFNPGGNTSSFNVHLKEQNVHPLDQGNKSTLSAVGLKPKDLIGIPWRVAFALQADGWYLRQDIIWSKPNPMPESVTDRCTKAHEYIFMLTKSARYHYDADAIAEPAIYSGLTNQDESGFKDPRDFNGKHKEGYRTDKQRGHSRRHAGFNARWDAMEKREQCSGTRNKRSVWEVATRPFADAHFATFPPALVEPCVLAGCPVGGTILDPFGGAGTVGLVADRLERNAILIELNPAYADMAAKRVANDCPMFATVESPPAKMRG